MKTINGNLLDILAWNSGDNLQAAHSGKFFVPAQASTSIVVIPAGLPAGVYCSIVNLNGVDIRSTGKVQINGTTEQGISFTTSLQYAVINIRSYGADNYSVTVEPQSEDVIFP